MQRNSFVVPPAELSFVDQYVVNEVSGAHDGSEYPIMDLHPEFNTSITVFSSKLQSLWLDALQQQKQTLPVGAVDTRALLERMYGGALDEKSQPTQQNFKNQ